MARKGRPPKPLDPGASAAAKLGAELRTWRVKRDLTQVQLGELIGFAPQHVSAVERAKGSITGRFVRACDQALKTGGALAELRDAAVLERDEQRAERESSRCPRCSAGWPTDQFSSLPCGGPDGDAGDGEDVEPTTRLGLIEASAVTALGTLGGLGAMAVPARARDVNPELPAHWAQLLNVLGVHFEMLGPCELRVIVRHQIDMLASHRAVASGVTRTAIVREEARWADFAAWLCDEIGQSRAGDAWMTQALLIARDVDHPDMIAYARGRQSERASDERRAVAYAEDALRVRGASAQTRAWCARQAAHA
ncbi:MAG: helix-turn-helix domain-containing protein, partial [Solirubrobacteraceae bacterium]